MASVGILTCIPRGDSVRSLELASLINETAEVKPTDQRAYQLPYAAKPTTAVHAETTERVHGTSLVLQRG